MQEQASKDDKQVFAACMAKNIPVDLITLAGRDNRANSTSLVELTWYKLFDCPPISLSITVVRQLTWYSEY